MKYLSINVPISVDLHLKFEKSSLKNPVQRTGLLALKNQLRNRFLQTTQAVKIQFEVDLKSSLSKLIFPTWFFKIQVQINRGHASLIAPSYVTYIFLCSTHSYVKVWLYKLESQQILKISNSSDLLLKIVFISSQRIRIWSYI